MNTEFYKCVIEVMRGAGAASGCLALPRHEAVDIEYWAPEEVKVKPQRMPP